MPLPAYPWQQRPDDSPLTAEEVCSALAEHGGSILRAAARLKVGTLILRKFVERSARARAVVREMNDLRCDRAADLLDEALESNDDRRQDWAIRYVLNSRNAKRLGWSSQETADGASQSGPLVSLTVPNLQWQDGTVIGPKEAARQIIDLTPAPQKTAVNE
jgi:hypothetical protein